MSFLSSRSRAMPRGFGTPLKRQEDPRLITGRGRFSDDFALPGQVHACFVRSPHPHARIRAIDPAAALALPGVLAVLTGRHAAADGLADIPHRPVPTNPNEYRLAGPENAPIFVAPYPPLPTDRARFAGEVVAMVLAETAALAAEAAERVRVDWEPLPSVTATRDAVGRGAPQLWDSLAGNVCVDSLAGDTRAAAAAFAAAAHVVRLDTWVPRITGVPMEPRAALGVHDAATGRVTLYAGSGGSVRLKSDLAEVLRVPEASVRVVAQDVGGNYGTRNSSYPEYSLVVWAARRLGRPVKWTGDRREMFLSDYQARDLVSTMELALDADGSFLGLRGTNTSNVGAHAVTFVPLNKGRELSTTVYRLPVAAVRGRAVHSNTSPLAAYRSAGRLGRLRVAPRGGPAARALPRHRPRQLHRDRHRRAARAGAGHRAARRLHRRDHRHALGGPGPRDGVPPAHRGMARGRAGPRAADRGRHRPGRGGRRLALRPLHAPGRRGDGQGFRPARGARCPARGVAARIRGRGRGVRGAALPRSRDRPRGGSLRGRGPLEGECDETVSTPSFPYGSAVCEVEVDPETGAVEIVRYSSVDDVGRAINPLIVHGQTHGGIAQGVGQALWELSDYDPESGQLRSATFMDYAMPRADRLPSFATEISEVESTSNPLGLRGGGEGGTTPALAAVVNAICDALAELGVEHIEMPATPERVWQSIQAARRPHGSSA